LSRKEFIREDAAWSKTLSKTAEKKSIINIDDSNMSERG
jgi:hypothetical protein